MRLAGLRTIPLFVMLAGCGATPSEPTSHFYFIPVGPYVATEPDWSVFSYVDDFYSGDFSYDQNLRPPTADGDVWIVECEDVRRLGLLFVRETNNRIESGMDDTSGGIKLPLVKVPYFPRSKAYVDRVFDLRWSHSELDFSGTHYFHRSRFGWSYAGFSAVSFAPVRKDRVDGIVSLEVLYRHEVIYTQKFRLQNCATGDDIPGLKENLLAVQDFASDTVVEASNAIMRLLSFPLKKAGREKEPEQ